MFEINNGKNLDLKNNETDQKTILKANNVENLKASGNIVKGSSENKKGLVKFFIEHITVSIITAVVAIIVGILYKYLFL